MSKGGYRWGRPRAIVEHQHELTAWGVFRYSHGNHDPVRVSWKADDAGGVAIQHKRLGQTHMNTVRLVSTPCNYGGMRHWFSCPGCGQRVAKIFLPGNIYRDGRLCEEWRCRGCWGLSYEQRRARCLSWCYEWRLERLAARWLGKVTEWGEGAGGREVENTMSRETGWIEKKKGQHWRTFHKRADEYDRLTDLTNMHDMRKMAGFLPR